MRDQAAHTIAAIVILLPLVLWPNLFTGAFAGFGIGLVREITEEGEVSFPAFKHALHSWFDLTFWTVGGLAVAIIGGLNGGA